MGTTAAIFPATAPADIDHVRALFRDYAASIEVDLCFQDFERELAELPGKYAPPAGGLWLAWIGDRAVGCIGLRPLETSIGEVKRLYVASIARGAGVGRRLVQELINAARAAGYQALRLDTLASMTAAQRLYEQFGFVTTPPYCFNPIPGARYMELRL